jgi:hypothetical protein
MVQLPWWVIAVTISIVLFLVVQLARLSDKVRGLKRIVRRLEGEEEEEIKDSGLGNMEGRG